MVADKLRRKIQAYGYAEGILVTASFGVAELLDGDDIVKLVLRADKGLYEAKRKGKNRVEAFSGSVDLK